ncbi:MAG: hypothetical protein KKH74_06200 [Gammaproteobacteria bacterium]|nr:hypothetical protein [Gammaproteobacteria bacterium]MBU1732236.1 hypothetical protein [Gammaproteobacteria bacterium]MBU1893806.1 hypothetical protein [Gammaproteobacteria bacterium]
MVRELGNIFTWMSIALLIYGYIWSIIIAYRANKGLFFIVILFWLIGYPILLAKYWQQTKKSFLVILAGLVSFALAFVLLAATNPNKVQSVGLRGMPDKIAQQGAELVRWAS